MAKKEEQIKQEIILDGEREYKAACKAINTSLREIGSEMKLVSAEFADNENSIEGLTAKQKILQKQFDEQAKKAEEAEKALEKLRSAGIEPTDPAYQKMQTNLNNTKAEMVKIQREIDGTSKKLNTSKVNWEQVGNVVGKVGKAFGTALVAIGTAAVGAASALAGMTVSAAAYADEVLTTATNTHIAAEDLQKYQYALNFIDGDIETLTKTMRKNTQIMDDARNGNAEYAAAYDALGVSITGANGELRDGETVYWEVIDALGEIENETERDALAMTLLGRNATELNTIIDAGSETFRAMGEEAEAMGAVLSDDALKALGSFDDQVQRLKAGLSGLKNSAALIALPFLDDLASNGIPIIAEFSKSIQAANGDVSKMGGAIGKGLADVVNLIVKKLPEFVGMGVNMVASLSEGIVSNAPIIAEAAIQIVETLVDGIAELLPMLIEGAAQLIAGLADGIGQSAPTLIPTIIEVILQIVQTLIDNIPLLVDAALQLVTGLAQGIINAIPVLVAALPALIDGIIGAILSAIPMIIEAGIELLSALVTALPDIIAAIVQAIPEIINGIISALMENIPMIIQAGVQLMTALVQNLPQIITTIAGAIPEIIGGIVDALIGNIDQIIMAGVQLMVALVQNIPQIVAEIGAAIPEIVGGIAQAILNLRHMLIEAGGDLLRGLWEGISGAAGWLWEQVSGWASGLISKIKGLFGINSPSTVFASIGGDMAAGVGVGFNDSMTGVEGDMNAAMSGAGNTTAAEAVRAVNNGIMANVAGLSGAVTAIVEQVITGLTAQAARLTQAGVDFATNIAQGMVTGIVQITSNIPQIVQATITAFVAQHARFVMEGQDIDKQIAQGMVSGISTITSRVPQVVQPIITALRSFVSQFSAAGKEMAEGVWSGFQSMAGWLESNVRDMMRDIVDAVEDEMDINSPSKVFDGIGVFMARGIGTGFAREMRAVEKTIRRETAATVPAYGSTAASSASGQSAPVVSVTQYINANETSYAQQQREAARQFRMIAREVMA